MFRHLVVPLDGSEFAAHALPVGMQLAAAAGASVRVLGVARTDTELAWTYDHVVADAQRAGVDVADVEVRVDPDPTAMLVTVTADEHNELCFASHLPDRTHRNLDALRRVTRDRASAASCRRHRAARVYRIRWIRRRRCTRRRLGRPAAPRRRDGVGASTGRFPATRHGVRTGAGRSRRPEPVSCDAGGLRTIPTSISKQ